MEKSKVFFTDLRTPAYGDGLTTKLQKLLKKAGIEQLDMDCLLYTSDAADE